jgi:hypothetical protein
MVSPIVGDYDDRSQYNNLNNTDRQYASGGFIPVGMSS